MSAAPSARRQNFSAEPHASVVTGAKRSRNCCARRLVVRAADRCDALLSAMRGCGSRSAPRSSPSADDAQPLGAVPAAPRHSRPRAGAATTPTDRHAVAHQRDIDRVFVAAGEELGGAVERIDQHIVRRLCGVARRFLRHDRHAGQAAARPGRIAASAASSAAVTIERSAFCRVATLRQSNRRMAAAARDRQRGEQRRNFGRRLPPY